MKQKYINDCNGDSSMMGSVLGYYSSLYECKENSFLEVAYMELREMVMTGNLLNVRQLQ
jgi:hypothetical protein